MGHAGHDYDVCACARKHARMLACMHTIFWCAKAHISAKFGLIREIKVSTESGGHAGHNYGVCAYACKHARMLAKFGQIREIKVYTESGDYARPL